MKKFKVFKFLSKLNPPDYLRVQLIKLFVTVALFLLIPLVVNLRLGFTQPPISESSVIELPVPSPRSSLVPPAPNFVNIPSGEIEDVVLDKQVDNSTVKVGSKQLAALCDGITEQWKLVPNPGADGQYIICNSDIGEMVTAGELNSAQNNYRVNHGLNTLSIGGQLCSIAAERAKEVASNFSHDGFEAAVDRQNLQKSSVGENIASGPLTAVQFVEWSWNKSPGHRANMLGDWSEGCAGVHDRFAVFVFAK